MKKTVRYVFEEPIRGIMAAEFTVGTVNILGMGEHAKLAAEYRYQFEETAGLAHNVEITPEQYQKIDPALRAYSTLWNRWARVKASLREVKGALEGSDEYLAIGLDELGWDTLDGIGTVPSDLLEALDRASVQCNPGIFGLYAQDDSDPNERKVGVVKIT